MTGSSLPPAVADLARKRVSIDMKERRKATAVEVMRIVSDYSKRGLLYSSALVIAVGEQIESEYRVRAGVALSEWRRAFTAAGVAPTPEMRHAMFAEIEQTLDGGSPDLPEHYGRAMTPANPPGINPQHALQTMRDSAVEWAGSELDFDLAAAARAKAGGTAPTTVNVYGGQIGAIQTGRGATATIHQSDIRQLLTALEAVRRAVHETAEIAKPDRDQIVGLVDAATAEAKKDKPNALTLGSLGFGVGTAIQTVAALRPAYELLKGALAVFGVNLPW